MKIAITGGAGFIGSHVAALLKKHELTVFDISDHNVEKARKIKGDITTLNSVVTALEGVEVVIHLAAFLGVEKSDADPLKTLEINVQGTRNVLEACRINNVKKIVFSSSSEIYGEPIKIPIQESDTPRPLSTYGVSKLAAEEYIKAYSKAYEIKYAILRFFSVYGPRQEPEFVMPRFVKLALENQPLTIHGDGSQIRAFCHVEDVARAVVLGVEKGENETLNIGNPDEPISIKSLAEEIIKKTNSQSKLSFLNFRESKRSRAKEIIHRVPSIERANKILGYKPSVDLNTGISSVVSYFSDAK